MGENIIELKEQNYEKLKKQGLEVVMLTGDNEITANIIGEELGIMTIIVNVMPSDKTKYIKDLQANDCKWFDDVI